MEWQRTQAGWTLRGGVYAARLTNEAEQRLEIEFDGVLVAQLPVVSALCTVDDVERLSDIRLIGSGADKNCARLEFTAHSNLWKERRFSWRFYPRRIEHSHSAKGDGALGRCYFASTGRSEEYANGDSQGHTMNLQLHVPHYFTPNVNLANVFEFDISQPTSVGLRGEDAPPKEPFMPDKYHGLFSPAPLCMVFYADGCSMAAGIGAKPGDYRFNALEYSGSKFAGASLHVQYHGYTRVRGAFESPVLALHFGHNPYDALQKHVDWVDEMGYGTAFRFETPAWHRAPFFCGWAEQTAEANRNGPPAGQLATQANYERWIEAAERRGLPISTIVIDDKWQRGYGSFDVDLKKWPDMPGFIARQHEKGRHVLLWVPGYHIEGIPDGWCVRDAEGRALFADVTNPDYEAFLRGQIKILMLDVGADGFKEDWIAPTAHQPGLQNYGALHGLELLRRFQFILHDAAHQAKPDALVETQTPHPLYRESSDVLRLNDIWYASRGVPEMMRKRARIARIAGWDVLDCDNASSTTIDEWFRYAMAQGRIGVPSLYFVTETEVTHERPSDAQWQHLIQLWNEYTAKNL